MLDAVSWPHAWSYFSWKVNPGLTGTILAGLTGTVPVSPGVSQLAPVVIELNPCGYLYLTKIYVCQIKLTFVRPTLDCMYWRWTQCGCYLVSTQPIVHRGSGVIFCIILLQFKTLCSKGIYMFIYSSPLLNYLESS